MSMTMESAPSPAPVPRESELPPVNYIEPIITRVPSQEELKDRYGSKSNEGSSVADKIEPDDLDRIQKMFNIEIHQPSTEVKRTGSESLKKETKPGASRLAALLSRLSEGAQSAGDKLGSGLADAADRQQKRHDLNRVERARDIVMQTRERQERAEARQEKIDATKEALRKIGRGALSLPDRVSDGIRKAKIEAGAQFTVAKETAAEKRDAAVNKAKEVAGVVSDGFDRVTDAAADTYDKAAGAVEKGIENVADAYKSALEFAADKREAFKNYFAEKKVAAIARKEARQQAHEQARLKRQAEAAKRQEVNRRVEAQRTEQLRRERAARIAAKAALKSSLTAERA